MKAEGIWKRGRRATRWDEKGKVAVPRGFQVGVGKRVKLEYELPGPGRPESEMAEGRCVVTFPLSSALAAMGGIAIGYAAALSQFVAAVLQVYIMHMIKRLGGPALTWSWIGTGFLVLTG